MSEKDTPAAILHGHYKLPIADDVVLIDNTIRNAIIGGGYKATEASLLLEIVTPEDSVLELGAGLGFITTLLSIRCRPGSYQAVEADARLIPMIRRTLALNNASEIHLLNAVLTEDPGKLAHGSVFFKIGNNFCESHVTDEDTGRSVPTFSLNAALRERAVTVLIVDIEGGELDLFTHADLSTVRAVNVELHPRRIGREGIRKVLSDLNAQDFIYDARHSSHAVITATRPG